MPDAFDALAQELDALVAYDETRGSGEDCLDLPKAAALLRARIEPLVEELKHQRSHCYKHYSGDDACECDRINAALAAWQRNSVTAEPPNTTTPPEPVPSERPASCRT